jgi:hypothetical protein
MTDVRTGETFRLADFVRAGQVVFVEPMAIWCTSCRAQQERAMQAFERLDPARVVWVGLDVETAESAEQLAAYADERGFTFRYVIADRDLARALVEAFGEVILSPPATNLIRIDVRGGVSHTVGGHSADELVVFAEAAGA